jgi:hypothetical protein
LGARKGLAGKRFRRQRGIPCGLGGGHLGAPLGGGSSTRE